MSHERDALVGVEGSVKWFDPRKPEGQDIFVHFSVIEGDGFKVLRDGARVHYDASNSDKGWKATRVRRAPTITVVDRTHAPQEGQARS
jgi:cold shock protein